MIELQIINKILKQKNLQLVTMHGLTAEHFIDYDEEFKFILEHYHKYKKVPDIESFLAKFEDFDVLDVTESDQYLIETINESHLFYNTVPIINETVKLANEDSNKAVEYLRSQLPNLTAKTYIRATDLSADSYERFENYVKMQEKAAADVISTGLPELDEAVFGWMPGEDLITILARTNQGKSWLLLQFLVAAWQQGKTVGLYSGEISSNVVGYRVDTLLKGFSNMGLMRGNKKEYDEYAAHITQMGDSHPFVVVTPKHLGGKATVSRLTGFAEKYGLEMLGVDQYSLMLDERSKKNETPRIMLGHITDDLFTLSIDQGIPIIGASQANRAGKIDKEEEGTPELEHTAESDLIPQNSTRVIAMRQSGAGLELGVKKNRYGAVGGKVIYYWDIDRGSFKYVPSTDDVMSMKGNRTQNSKRYNDKASVF